MLGHPRELEDGPKEPGLQEGWNCPLSTPTRWYRAKGAEGSTSQPADTKVRVQTREEAAEGRALCNGVQRADTQGCAVAGFREMTLAALRPLFPITVMPPNHVAILSTAWAATMADTVAFSWWTWAARAGVS